MTLNEQLRNYGHFPVWVRVWRGEVNLWSSKQAELTDYKWRATLTNLLTGRAVNPSVAGFIDEKIVLTIISDLGLNVTASREEEPAKGKRKQKAAKIKKSLTLNLSVSKTIYFPGQWQNTSQPALSSSSSSSLFVGIKSQKQF